MSTVDVSDLPFGFLCILYVAMYITFAPDSRMRPKLNGNVIAIRKKKDLLHGPINVLLCMLKNS